MIEGFITHNGPLYMRRDRAGRVTFGMRVLTRHCNPLGVAHGGWLSTMCDMVMPLSARMSGGDTGGMLTINLSVDYLAGAPLGSWLEGESEELRRTKRLVFAQGLLRADGEPVARCSGVFRLARNAFPKLPGVTDASPFDPSGA